MLILEHTTFMNIAITTEHKLKSYKVEGNALIITLSDNRLLTIFGDNSTYATQLIHKLEKIQILDLKEVTNNGLRYFIR